QVDAIRNAHVHDMQPRTRLLGQEDRTRHCLVFGKRATALSYRATVFTPGRAQSFRFVGGECLTLSVHPDDRTESLRGLEARHQIAVVNPWVFLTRVEHEALEGNGAQRMHRLQGISGFRKQPPPEPE